MKCAVLSGGCTHRVVGVVETEAAYDAAYLMAGEGRKQLLDGQHILGDLRTEVGNRTEDLVRLDRVPELECNANCTMELLRWARRLT